MAELVDTWTQNPVGPASLEVSIPSFGIKAKPVRHSILLTDIFDLFDCCSQCVSEGRELAPVGMWVRILRCLSGGPSIQYNPGGIPKAVHLGFI